MPDFELVTDLAPAGDQPESIAALVEGVTRGDQFQTLLGITGSGKSFAIANVIAQANRPTLVMAPNKSLAAQLAAEFRELFPKNRVEYFVSYYDYYQPEAYLPTTDTYIEKDSSINDEIDRLRHSATSALLSRRDVIIVASVSAIYGLGSPEMYAKQLLMLEVGEERDQRSILRRLVELQYERNDVGFTRNKFRVRGDTIEIFPAYEEKALRISLFGDEVERIASVDPLTGEIVQELQSMALFPASHYVTDEERLKEAIEGIEAELVVRLQELEEQRQAARSAAAPHAHHLRPRDAARGRELRGRRELLDAPRRPATPRAALHAPRLLPRRLAVHPRRVAPGDPAAPRPVRRRPFAQGHARRARLPPPVGDGQPAVAVRGVRRSASTRSCSCRPRPGRTSSRCRRRSSSRSCGRRA